MTASNDLSSVVERTVGAGARIVALSYAPQRGDLEVPAGGERVELRADLDSDARMLSTLLHGSPRALLVCLEKPLSAPPSYRARLIGRLLADLPSGVRVGLILPGAAVATPQADLREALVGECIQVEWLIWLGGVAFDAHPAVSIALVVVSRDEARPPIRIVDATSLTAAEALPLIDACAARGGGEVGRTLVRRTALDPTIPWSWARVSRGYEDAQRDTAELGELVPLGNLTERCFVGKSRAAIANDSLVRRAFRNLV